MTINDRYTPGSVIPSSKDRCRQEACRRDTRLTNTGTLRVLYLRLGNAQVNLGASLALQVFIFSGFEDGEEFGGGLGGDEVLADNAIGQETADGRKGFQVGSYRVAGAYD